VFLTGFGLAVYLLIKNWQNPAPNSPHPKERTEAGEGSLDSPERQEAEADKPQRHGNDRGRKAAPPSREAGDKRLDPLIRALRSDVDADRIAAAQRLSKMGSAAKPAARALCEAATNDSPKVRQSAIEALEVIHPELAKPVTTLLVDREYFNVHNAIGAIESLGGAGVPAIPLLIWFTKTGLAKSEYPNHVPAACEAIVALGKIGPTDSEAIESVIGYARSPLERDYNRFIAKQPPLKTLGDLSQNKGDKRKRIVACLAIALSALETGDDYQGDQLRKAAIDSISKYGRDARIAVPTLKQLKLSPNIEIRQAAAAALEKIDKD
jgi:HEAT repeat protein